MHSPPHLPRWRARRQRMRLRLPHAGLHGVLGRLQPEQLRRLAGGTLPADPARAVARGIGRIARRARRVGPFPGGAHLRLDVYAAPGFRILVRRVGEMEGEIVGVTPAPAEIQEEVVRSMNAAMKWYGPFRLVPRGSPMLVPTVEGQKVPALTGSGIYLLEKRFTKDWRPVYVGKAEPFQARLGARREHLRQAGVDLGRYRVYLGLAASGTSDLHALEHAVVRSVMRGWHRARMAADPDRATAAKIPVQPLTNVSPRAPFRVGAGGLAVKHRVAGPQHARPRYLRSGKGTHGQWYEVPE